MFLNLALRLTLTLSLLVPVQALPETHPQTTPSDPDKVPTATLTLPVLSETGEKVDELQITFAETKANNKEEIITAAEQALGLQAVEVQLEPQIESKSIFQKMRDKIAGMRKRDPGLTAGLMVATVSSTMGGFGLYHFGGTDIMNSAIIGSTMMGIALFHGVFTNPWQSYLKSGLFIKNLAGLFKRSWKDHDLVRSFGNIAAGAFFNIFPTAFALYMTGGYTDLVTAAAIGVLGAYDYTIDIAAGRLHRRGHLTEHQMKTTVRSRMLFGPVLEMFSVAGHSEAQIAMGVIAIAGLTAIFRGEALMSDFKNVKKLAMKFVKPARDCHALLTATPKIHVRVAYDDTM